jgi:hypothetical protein
MSTTPIVTGAVLVAAVADGDAGALRELYERRGAWLWAIAFRRMVTRLRAGSMLAS